MTHAPIIARTGAVALICSMAVGIAPAAVSAATPAEAAPATAAATATHTLAELAGKVKATVGGKEIAGFDPTKTDQPAVPENTEIAITGLPSDWKVTQIKDSTMVGFTVTAPDGTTVGRWQFPLRNASATTQSANDLKTVTAVTDKGVKVSGFDPVKGGTFTVPAGTGSVTLNGIPGKKGELWTETRQNGSGSTPMSITLTSKDKKTTVTYRFVVASTGTTDPSTKPNGGTTGTTNPNGDVVDALKNVKVLVDGQPTVVFSPVKDGTFSLATNAKTVTVTGLPAGYKSKDTVDAKRNHTIVVTDAKGGVVATWRFVRQSNGVVYSVNDLKNVTATVGGRTVPGFTPTRSGTWKVRPGSFILIRNVPSGWKHVEAKDTNGRWLQWTITSPDGRVKVTWKFVASNDATVGGGQGTGVNASDDATRHVDKSGDTTPAGRGGNGNLAQTGVAAPSAGLATLLLAAVGGVVMRLRRHA